MANLKPTEVMDKLEGTAEKERGRAPGLEQPVASGSQPYALIPVSTENGAIVAFDGRIEWKPFRLTANDCGRVPTSVMDFFLNQTEEDGLSVFDYATLLVTLCMIETGFVPVSGTGTEIDADELMSEPLNRRMDRLIALLANILQGKGGEQFVTFKYLKLLDPVPDSSSYAYGDELLNLACWHNCEAFFQLKPKSRSWDGALFQTMLSEYMNCQGGLERFGIFDMIQQFNSYEFMAHVKQAVCAVFIDKYSSVTPELLGFLMLPDEMIVHVSKFLDGRSFVAMLMTCNRVKSLLNTEKCWKNQCKRMAMDFAEYGLPVPGNLELPTPVKGKPDYRRFYVREYEEALEQARDLFREDVEDEHELTFDDLYV